MGRAKNTEVRQKIYTTAIRLFSENGYVGTSFSDIAKACGVERTLVQYYFPHKDILIRELLDSCLTQIADMAQNLSDDRFDIFGKLYYMGLVSFDFLINSEKMQRLTTDIVASRQLTEVMMPLYRKWDKWFMGSDFEEDAAMLSMGGAYELIYHYKKNDVSISSKFLAEKTYIMYTAWHGVNPKDAMIKLLDYQITDEELKKAVDTIEKSCLY